MIRRAADGEGLSREQALRQMDFPQLVESIQRMFRLERVLLRIHRVYPPASPVALADARCAIEEMTGEMVRRLTPLDFGAWFDRE